ncbi:MAG: hypothetical protein O7D94_13375 [Planctomycetota bacterium]|nr:hypothetical protein [Planctomycetota bacterium]
MGPWTENSGREGILRDLTGREARPLVRIVASLISGLFLCALALAGSFLLAFLRDGTVRVRIRDIEYAFAFAVMGGVWVAVLAFIWRGMGQGGFPTQPMLITAGLAGVTICGGFAIEALPLREEEILIAALVLFAGGLGLLVWLPRIRRLRVGRPVLDAEDRVNVYCPDCGYSLIGLRDLRCPECGAAFMIDELIRRQNYEANAVGSNGRAGADSGSGSRAAAGRGDRPAVGAAPDTHRDKQAVGG